MGMIEGIKGEIQFEAGLTRKMLERVPEDALEWAPHPRSFTMRRLASHLAEIYGWTGDILQKTELVFTPESYKPWFCKDHADLMAKYDEALKKCDQGFEGVTDADLMTMWTLKMGERVIFTQPRIGVLRGFVIKHAVHHRAQLTVYFRMCGIPVPSIYGPSGDEQG